MEREFELEVANVQESMAKVERRAELAEKRHRDAEVASHGHDHAQLILYLTGEGVQTVHTRRRRARAGDLFVIPAHTPHGFSVAGKSLKSKTLGMPVIPHYHSRLAGILGTVTGQQCSSLFIAVLIWFFYGGSSMNDMLRTCENLPF